MMRSPCSGFTRRQLLTRIDFSASTPKLETIRQKILNPPKTLQASQWRILMELGHRFRCPPNDERLLALNDREAAETLFAMVVLDERERDPAKFKAAGDAVITQGMVLTGDPEWDAMELERHDPANRVG